MIPKVQNLAELRYEYERMIKAVRAYILDKYNHQCVKCGSTDKLQIDHIIALSLGGTNDLDNLQVLCKPCNTSKGGRRMGKGERGEGGKVSWFNIPDDLKAKALKVAEDENRTLSNLILTALKEYLKKKKA